MNVKDYNTYFEQNASSWILDGYSTDGYNYKTPENRLRVISSFLDTVSDIRNAIDIGCGGGHISIELARRNIIVHAIDRSTNMLLETEKNISLCPATIQKKITFSSYEFSEIPNNFYDCAVAMGLIGYLENDELFFEKLISLVKKGGYAIVSFRNRLFNLFSISHRTIKECETGTILELIKESENIHKEISIEDTKKIILALNLTTSQLLESIESISKINNEPQTKYTDAVEPRQTTPAEAIETAKKFGFKTIKLTGIHPHFLVPKLNKCILPGIYNKLSDSLIPLEEHPMALLWSSVFIAFLKRE